MKKTILFLLFITSFVGYSQEDAWVYFTDKPDSAAFLSNPISMLTQRSLDRRAAQNIPLDILDVPIHQPYYDQIFTSNGISLLAKSKWLNCVHVRGLQADINALLALSFVDHIVFADNSLNIKMANPHQIVPVNKTLETQVTFNYGNSYNQLHMLNGHLLHQQNFTGTGKVIAVLDAGFPGVDTAQPFERLFANNAILGGYDFVNKSNNFYTGYSHGTLVLSCMGGFTDGQLVGTAPDANYYLYITEDVNSENPVEESNWVEAAEEADRVGADIITSSLGYFGYDNPAYSHTYNQMTGNIAFASKGANIAFSRGIVCVASAGNSAQTADPHIGVPAEATHVLAIGAVKFDETYASFSSIGPSFDGRVKPDVCAQGQASVLSDTSGNIITASGTSFSGPIMAGMIASFWQAVPNLTNQQVVDFVRQSADRYTTPNAQFGYGIPDFQLAINNVALGTKTNISNGFSIYPNPTNDNINVAVPNDLLNSKISFYNTLGQVVLEKNINQLVTNILLNSLNSGIYMYKLENELVSKSGKIIKN